METRSRQDQFLISIDSHKKILSRVAQTYCGDPSDRADLIQDILAQLWMAMPRYDPSRNFAIWMYRIAINSALSSVSSNNANKKNREAADALSRALVLLSLEDYSESEISEIIGLEESLVNARLDLIRPTAEERKNSRAQDDELERALIIPPLSGAPKLALQRNDFSRTGQALGSEMVIALFFLTGIFAFTIQLKSRDVLYIVSGVVAFFASLQVAWLIYQIKIYMSMDWAESSSRFYQRLLKLKISRSRFVKWTFIIWMFLWLPVLAIAAKAFLGIDIYPFFAKKWLILNGIFSLVVICISFVLAHFYGSIFERFGPLRRIVDSLAGQSLSGAVESLRAAREFASTPKR